MERACSWIVLGKRTCFCSGKLANVESFPSAHALESLSPLFSFCLSVTQGSPHLLFPRPGRQHPATVWWAGDAGLFSLRAIGTPQFPILAVLPPFPLANQKAAV